jgi:hypothetical protein
MPKSYLEFTVIAAIVTTCGTILGLFIKDFLFVRYFDNLRDQKSLKKISKKYKDPLLLVLNELLGRVEELRKYKAVRDRYLKSNLFKKVDYLKGNSSSDPYYVKYRIVSTLYRFCALFGWLEMYRQDITFLDSHSKKESFKSLDLIEKIRTTIADGRLNNQNDWKLWNDVLIFREELRSVGEGMIEMASGQKSITGYGRFQMLIDDFEKEKKPLWLKPVINFFTEFQEEKDFRIKRIELLVKYLSELIKCLDKAYYNKQVRYWIETKNEAA